MTEIVVDKNLVAFCGLYRGACRSYLKGKCPGCEKNEKAGWCKIRTCCANDNLTSCAECKTHKDPNDCKKFNNLVARIIGFIARSNRSGCISMIREKGLDDFAKHMAENKIVSLKR